jgi:hypothetical protein
MDTKIITDGEKLTEWMGSIPHNQFKENWRYIMKVCNVEYYTVVNWRNNCCKISDENKAKIEAIAGKKIF